MLVHDDSETAAADGNADRAVLTMANAYASLAYEPAVLDFVTRVHAISAGAMKLEVSNEWGNGRTDAERQVVDAVRTGAVDLGWVGTRVFDTFGLRSFQALTAPMLIDSHAVQRAVFDDGIPDRMLAALGDPSLVGLAVLAGGLRKPIAVNGPLLEPADWRGITFQTLPSDGHTDAVGALGATHATFSPAGPDHDLDAGLVQAFDKDLLIYAINGTAPRAPYVGANVNLWPETAILLANPHRLMSLSQSQQGWLRQAAADAAAHSTRHADRDADLVGQLCRRGARFANATDAQLTALRRAFAPAYARLNADPVTSSFIAEIERLKGSVHAETLEIPIGCTGSAPATRRPVRVKGEDDVGVLNGVYRTDLLYGDLVALGKSPADARAAAATHTLTLKNGRWTRHSAGPEYSLDCGGVYLVADNHVTFIGDPLPDCNYSAGNLLSAVWTMRGRDLTLRARRCRRGWLRPAGVLHQVLAPHRRPAQRKRDATVTGLSRSASRLGWAGMEDAVHPRSRARRGCWGSSSWLL